MIETPQCFDVPKIDKQEIQALKALYQGEATEGQQRLALHAIVNKMARAHDVLYIPGDNGRDSAFLSGRAFVGQQILMFLKLPVSALKAYDDTPTKEG